MYAIVRDYWPNGWQLIGGVTDLTEPIGYKVAEGRSIKSLLAKVPKGEKVYRIYLQRTDGKEGSKELKRN